MSKIVVGDGKYTIYHLNGVDLRAYRYEHDSNDEPWRNLVGDGMVLALVQRIEELELALKEAVTDHWHSHHTIKGLCSLCGNSGVVNTTGVKTNAGVEVGRRNFCICPNGQAMRVHVTLLPVVHPIPNPNTSVYEVRPVDCRQLYGGEFPTQRKTVCKHDSVEPTPLGWRCRSCGASV